MSTEQDTKEQKPSEQKSNEQINLSDMLTLYWNYYQLHAEQRLKILELFISVEVVLVGGCFIALFNQSYSAAIAAAVGISIVAILCYLIDVRTTELLHHCRTALREFEKEHMTQFNEEYHLFTSVKKKEGSSNYSKLIRGAYFILFFIGIILILVA